MCVSTGHVLYRGMVIRTASTSLGVCERGTCAVQEELSWTPRKLVSVGVCECRTCSVQGQPSRTSGLLKGQLVCVSVGHMQEPF